MNDLRDPEKHDPLRFVFKPVWTAEAVSWRRQKKKMAEKGSLPLECRALGLRLTRISEYRQTVLPKFAW
jgi:hypothetical protein